MGVNMRVGAKIWKPLGACLLCFFGALDTLSAQNAPVELRYKNEAGQAWAWKIEATQDSNLALAPAAEAPASAKLTGEMRCLVGAVSPGNVPWEVRFRDLGMKLTAQGKTLEAERFTGELGELLLSAVLDDRGRLVRSFIKGGNPQVVRTVRLLEDAFVRALPVMPTAPVELAASWSDEAKQEDKHKQGEVASSLRRTWTLQKLEDRAGRRVALLEVKLQGEVKVTPKGGAVQTQRLQGEGTVAFDLQAGRVLESNLTLQTEDLGAQQAWTRRALVKVRLWTP
jgi:hypothetical protein